MLVLLRHGESEGNAGNLLLGRLESPLTDRGRAQARAIARDLGGSNRIITSPLGRARQTAEIVAAACGVSDVEVDERWIEVDYGEYDGSPLGEVPHEVWAKWRSDPSFRPPGGESLADVGKRVRAACEDLFAQEATSARAEGDVVVVSHVSPIKAAVAWAVDASDEAAWRLYLATGSKTVIKWGVDRPVLHAFNVTAAD